MEKMTNAERCRRHRLRQEYETKVQEYYARGGTNQNLKISYGWTDEEIKRKLEIINDYNPPFLGKEIVQNLLAHQIANLINKKENPTLLYCQIGAYIENNYDGMPGTIIGLLHRAYKNRTIDLYFNIDQVAILLKSIFTREELKRLAKLLNQ